MDDISHQDFLQFQSLLYKGTGIFLSEKKQALLVGRLSKRMRCLGMTSMKEYLNLINSKGQDLERIAFFDAISTNETKFFRNAPQFEYFSTQVLPEWIENNKQISSMPSFRIWSAACSTGEEPYTLAMIIDQSLNDPRKTGNYEILASDLSCSVLDVAKKGIYPISRVDSIPETYRKHYVLRGSGGMSGKIKVSKKLSSHCTFQRINLIQTNLTCEAFDIIYCRNVFIYFDNYSRIRALEGLLRHLKPKGYLFLGSSENLPPLTIPMERMFPSVYRRR